MRNFIFIFFTIIFINGCSTKTAQIVTSNSYNLKLDLKQDTKILPKLKKQEQLDGSVFMKRYFGVWNNTKPDTSKKDAFWALNVYKNSKHRSYYGPNRSTYSDKFFKNIKENSSIDEFGKISKPAITLKNTFLRNAPSHEPIFKNFSHPSGGYPFDQFSNSTLGINYPLYVSHFSKNRDFAFVQNDTVWGWIDARDIKILNEFEINMFKNSNFITILDDRTPILDIEDNFLFYGRVGTILMNDSKDKRYYYGDVFTKNGLKRYKIKLKSATTWPAQINDKHLKQIIEGILGEPYGWGGFEYYRDCSLFTKDFMSVFGIWLPRNSKAQASIYKTIDLKNKTNEEKLEIIKNHGEPYFSLVYMPGHIMLYTGVIKNEVSVAHNVWGLRTNNNGRALIAKMALTTLEIGKENKDIPNSNLLLSKITKLVILSN
ncbi:NlpC/P60 family lipoprotein (SH3b1, SH3b2 type SH3 domains) [Campylobacter blaseri]|uniref:Glycoside hydrolase n=1 Tax=Campylobacter blaseri TaxID=2042961 RepID=A0A2P8QZN3_9BACT|nr:SH3 domain-containing C40 family peptidase [Campylobacter blaseri]PSM51699.1 hypothetical protein CQ405_06080 [Campylobacter blaseri]PSM53489.1 hypothetical protein CRN67_06080 [Campylobacter blaseri]QKF86294.1 NlpC/P60 family lipoprotein (SH3b1, SH3b2 type SH3 domains) [Campylobacter blaseri]